MYKCTMSNITHCIFLYYGVEMSLYAVMIMINSN